MIQYRSANDNWGGPKTNMGDFVYVIEDRYEW